MNSGKQEIGEFLVELKKMSKNLIKTSFNSANAVANRKESSLINVLLWTFIFYKLGEGLYFH